MTFSTASQRARAIAPTFTGSVDGWHPQQHYQFRRIIRNADSIDDARRQTGLGDTEIRSYCRDLEIPLTINHNIMTAFNRRYFDRRRGFNEGAGEMLLMERIEGNWSFEQRQAWKEANHVEPDDEIAAEPDDEVLIEEFQEKTRFHSSEVIRYCEIFMRSPKGTVSGRGRLKKQIATKRLAVHALKSLCPHLSYPQIGKAMGGYDHSSIHNHYNNPCPELVPFLKTLED